jgi:hypothetical protein
VPRLVAPARSPGSRLADPVAPAGWREVTTLDEIVIRKLDKVETTSESGNGGAS